MEIGDDDSSKSRFRSIPFGIRLTFRSKINHSALNGPDGNYKGSRNALISKYLFFYYYLFLIN